MRLSSRSPIAPLAGAALAAPHAAAARALFEDLPLIGTNGGTSFTRACPSGNVLTGVRWRTGAFVDGIGIQCSPIRADGTLGARVNVGEMAGGNGGTAGQDNCHGGVIAGTADRRREPRVVVLPLLHVESAGARLHRRRELVDQCAHRAADFGV